MPPWTRGNRSSRVRALRRRAPRYRPGGANADHGSCCHDLPSRVSLPGTNNRPPRTALVQEWGRFRSGSPQAQATNSAPADRCLPVDGGCVARVPGCLYVSPVGFPARLQAVANKPQRVVSVNPTHDGMWRRSHTLGGWRRPKPGSSRRRRAADRPLRAPGHRPPRVDHRPLQLPLHLLHAPGGHALARARRAAHLRGAGPDRAGGGGALRLRVGAHHRRGAHCPRAPAPADRDARSPRDRHRHDHQRREAPRDGPRPRRRRPAAHQRVARLAAPRGVPRAHPARRPRPGDRRHRRRDRRRPRAR